MGTSLNFQENKKRKLVTHKNLRNAFLTTTSGKNYSKKRCKTNIKEKWQFCKENGKSVVSFGPNWVKVINFEMSNVLSEIMVSIFMTFSKKGKK